MSPTTNTIWLAYLLVPALTLAVQGTILYWVYTRQWHRPDARTFAAMVAFGTVWTASVLARVALTDPLLEEVALVVWMLSSTASITLFIVFGSQFTNEGFHHHPLVKMFLVGLNAGHVAMVVAHYVVDSDLLWISSQPTADPFPYLMLVPGLGTVLWTFTLTVLALYTEYVMVRHLLSTGRRAGWQIALLVGGVLPVTIFEYVGQSGAFPADGFSHAPYGLALFYGCTALAAFRFDLFDVKPVARRAVVAALRDPVLVVDPDRRIVDYNDASTRLWPSIPERVGDRFEDVCSTLADQTGPLTGNPGESERVILGRNGRERHYSMEVSAVSVGRNERPELYAVVLRDVTDLERSRRQLQDQNQRLEKVAATISHDLRNPLNVIDGYGSLLADELAARDEDELAAQAELIDDAQERMGEIVDDVLAIAREGDTVENPEWVDLETVACDAWQTVDPDRGDLVVERGGRIKADPSRLRTILENLFRNAAEHGRPKDREAHSRGHERARGALPDDSASPRSTSRTNGDGVTVTVGLRESEVDSAGADADSRVADPSEGDGPDPVGGRDQPVGDEASVTSFFVQDDGPGISPEHRDDVFEYGVTTEDDGTGLGLSIVRTMAQSHGWTVALDERSEDGEASKASRSPEGERSESSGGARFVFSNVVAERHAETEAARTTRPTARNDRN